MLDAELPHHGFDLPRRHPLLVASCDRRHERVVRPLVRRQERRRVVAPPDLRYPQYGGPQPGLEGTVPVPVPVRAARTRALTVVRTNDLTDLDLHERAQDGLQTRSQGIVHGSLIHHRFDKLLGVSQTLLAGHPVSSCVGFAPALWTAWVDQFASYTNLSGTIHDRMDGLLAPDFAGTRRHPDGDRDAPGQRLIRVAAQ